MGAVCQLRGVSYAYGSGTVLHRIDFDLDEREIHALVGDHKAGKSTLARIMSGRYRPDSGNLLIGQRVRNDLTLEKARRLGIAMVQHELQIIPTMTALENIAIGTHPGLFLRRSYQRALHDQFSAFLESLNLTFDLHAPLHSLTEEQQQITEILKAIIARPRVLILDEISSRLGPDRLRRLFDILRTFKASGAAILYITADIDEVFQIADRVTVLRAGQRIGTQHATEMDRVRLVKMAFSFTSYVSTEADESTLFVRRYSEDLIQNLPIGAIVVDIHGFVVSTNVAARTTIDLSYVEAGTTHIEEILSRLFVAEAGEIIDAAIRGLEGTWDKVAMETDRVARIACYPVRSYDGAALGSMLFVEDVSSDYFAKEYLARAEQMSTIAEVAAGVAHEINNPLGIIQNYLELLRDTPETAEKERYIETIEGNVSMIAEIVGSLLSFSRLNYIPPRKTDPAALLDEVVLLLNHRLAEKEIVVERSYADEAGTIVALENKLRQLFMNLITNAVDAMLVGGTLTLTVRRLADANTVRIGVEDTGHGIPADLQSRIFNPFFSTKMTKTNAGLGLAVCRSIVDLHGGRISFRSRPGRTTFEVELPREPDADRLSDTLGPPHTE